MNVLVQKSHKRRISAWSFPRHYFRKISSDNNSDPVPLDMMTRTIKYKTHGINYKINLKGYNNSFRQCQEYS